MSLESRVAQLENNFKTLIKIRADGDESSEKQIIETSAKANILSAINGTSWNPSKTYNEGEYVVYGSSIARCKFLNVGAEPNNSTYWELKTIAEVLVELANKIKESE